MSYGFTLFLLNLDHSTCIRYRGLPSRANIRVCAFPACSIGELVVIGFTKLSDLGTSHPHLTFSCIHWRSSVIAVLHTFTSSPLESICKAHATLIRCCLTSHTVFPAHSTKHHSTMASTTGILFAEIEQLLSIHSKLSTQNKESLKIVLDQKMKLLIQCCADPQTSNYDLLEQLIKTKDQLATNNLDVALVESAITRMVKQLSARAKPSNDIDLAVSSFSPIAGSNSQTRVLT